MKRDGYRSPSTVGPRMLGGFEAVYVEPKKPSIWKAVLRRILGFFIVLALVSLILMAAADAYVRFLAKNRLYETVEAVPAGRPALVFGTAPYLAPGVDNPYFKARMEAAAALWKSGKVPFIIVSGDNRSRDYNEPQAMQNELVARGVPADRIVRDFAGLRTLDSVVRVKEVFGQTSVIFVTQGFHNERAICLARHHSIDAIGLNSGGEPAGVAGARNWLRERLARVRMILDLYVFDTGPKHLGPKEPVPTAAPSPTPNP